MPAVSFQSRAAGLAHPVSSTAPSKSIPPACFGVDFVFGPPLGVFGVGHPVKPLPDVRASEARSAGIDRADGVRLAFQVSVYSVEPSESEFACNLFANDSARAPLADEWEPDRPKIALIIERFSRAGIAEWLAGAGACPDLFFVRPPSFPEGVAPDPDAGEEVALSVSGEVGRSNIDN